MISALYTRAPLAVLYDIEGTVVLAYEYNRTPCIQTHASIELPKLVLLLTFLLQVVVVDQIRCVVRFKAGEISSLMLSDDFACRDFFREVVSVVWNHALEPLVSEFCLLHPNLLFAVGSEFKINALLHVVASV